MKKKIVSIAIMFMLFAGIVHASSINGDFNGNPIVKLKSNGQVLPVDDTPPIVYEGRTMVPIYMLKQLGIDVKWSQDTYTIDVKMPEQKNERSSVDDIAKSMKQYGIIFVMLYSTGDGKNIISYNYQNKFNDLATTKVQYFDAILTNSMQSDANVTEIVDADGVAFSVPTQAVRDFKSGKITTDQLVQQYVLTQGNGSTPSSQPSQSPAQTPQTGNNQPVQQPNQQQPVTTPQPSPQPSATPPQNDVHIQICKRIDEQYQQNLATFDRNNDPFNGRTSYLREQLDRDYQREKQAAGCN